MLRAWFCNFVWFKFYQF